jgi:hypothetical protein
MDVSARKNGLAKGHRRVRLPAMNIFTRRVITLLLCCWLPLPGLALATVECHLLDSAMANHGTLKNSQAKEHSAPEGEHSGCGTADLSTPAEAQTPCNHCQMACHNTQLLLIPTNVFNLVLEPHQAPEYALPLPQIVFINNPQRPPQAS